MVQLSLNKVFAVSAFALASIRGVAADLEVTTPSSSAWWVAQSTNLLAWTCQNTTVTNFTVLISNSNPAVLVQPQAIIAIQNTFDCSILVTQDQANQAPGTGYQILLADVFNSTDVFASSQPFEIKPLGSAFPAQSTAANIATASGTVSGSGTAAPSPTSNTKSGAFRDATLNMGLVTAGVAAVFALWA